MAAAAYLIREATLPGSAITIYERGARPGGSLEIFGDPESGYVYPGGRVFETHYRCAFDLFSFIPSRTNPQISIKDDVAAFNADFGWENHARLLDRSGAIVAPGPMGLRLRDRWDLLRILLTPDRRLQGKSIEDCVSRGFFSTPFWLIWSSIMAFRPRHNVIEMRRYMLRFLHLLPELWSMTFILRTRVNQHQAIVEPLVSWLVERGVTFQSNSLVTDITFAADPSRLTATALQLTRDGADHTVAVRPDDVVFVTNGSHVANLTTGSMTQAPPPPPTRDPWSLWRTLAAKRPTLGVPAAVADHPTESTWISFTVTDRGSRFAELMETLTGREAGRNGLVTLGASNWLITVTRFHHPNILDQPEAVFVWWGYGIYPERPGNFIEKPMLACTGAEILQEVLHHLRFDADAAQILSTSTCIPCRMPYAGSVFLWRRLTDRPKVVPPNATNLAFIGQFCEQPGDVPFTMEYSVRSAWTAVHTLTGKGRAPPPVYKGFLNPRILLRTAMALRA